MKKRSIIFLILLMTLFASVVSYADSGKMVNVKINGENLKVHEVPILLNNQIVRSDSPSFLYVDRTLVSARLIAESYGATVGWDNKERAAVIEHEGNSIVLPINKQVAKINGKNVEIDNSSIPRLVDFGNGQAKTMVPLTFISDILGYETDWDQEKKAAFLKKKEDPKKGESTEIKDSNAQNKKPAKEEVKKGKYNVGKIKLVDGGEKVVIEGGGKPKRNIMKLTNPDRIVIDLMDSELEGTSYRELKEEVGVMKNVRVSQFTPDSSYKKTDRIVRIVLDMENGELHSDLDLYEKNGDLYIVPEKSTRDRISLDKNIISISTQEKTDYDVSYDESSRLMTIKIDKNKIDLKEGKESYRNSFLSDIEVKNQGSYTLIMAKFRRAISYDILSAKKTDKIQIQFMRDKNIESSDRIIVVDPGHGGSDSGTSRGSIKEKEIALDTSLYLREILEDKGYEVIMTREEDVYPSLDDRVYIANSNDADVFVSIHANSVDNPTPKGIETLYAPNMSKPRKAAEQTYLATKIQESLIKNTKATDRRIKERPNLVVLRDTDMAAVLVELGFITNKEEASKLTSDSYRRLLAESIAEGIEEYFKIY